MQGKNSEPGQAGTPEVTPGSLQVFGHAVLEALHTAGKVSVRILSLSTMPTTVTSPGEHFGQAMKRNDLAPKFQGDRPRG